MLNLQNFIPSFLHPNCRAIYSNSIFTHICTMKFLWSLLVLFSALQLIAGWGDLGHRTVAYLAQKFLNDEGTHLLHNILRTDNNDDISDAAVWADQIGFQRPSTRPWHFIGMLSLS